MHEFITEFLNFHLPTTAAMLATCWCFLPKKSAVRWWHVAGATLGAALVYALLYLPVAQVGFEVWGGFLRTMLNVASGAVAIFLLQFLFKGTWYNKLLTGILFFVITFISELVVSITLDVSWVGMQGGDFPVAVIERGNITAWVTLVFVLLVKLVRRKPNIYGKRRFSVLQGAIFALCACSMATLYVSSYLRGNLTIADVILLCALVVLALLFYLSFESANITNKRNQEYALEQQRHELLEEYYGRVEAHQNEIRAIKHDMKNQLLAISGYMEGNNDEHAARQVEDLIHQLSASEAISFTANPGINALLGAKYRKAQAKNIVGDFTVKLPGETGIAENDLSCLVGNVLDNAIEACMQCAGQRYIRFKLVAHGGAVVLACENSYDGVSRSLKTRKADTQNHGYGMESIRRIVKRYGGDMQHQFGTHEFSLELTLFEPPQKP